MSTDSPRPDRTPDPGLRRPYEKPTLEFVEIFGDQVLAGTCKASGTGSAPSTQATGCAASSCTANGDS